MEETRVAGLSGVKFSPTKTSKSTNILFVHGWWGGAWVWSHFGQYFAEKGYTCYAINLSGNENLTTQKTLGRLSFYIHLDEVKRAIDELKNPIVVGHSVGGLLMQKAAEQADLPACVGIVPVAPRGIFSLVSFNLMRFSIEHAGAMLFRRPFLPTRERMYKLDLNCLGEDEQYRVYEQMVPASGRQGFEIGIQGIPVDATKVKAPMLIIGGEFDNLTPPQITHSIAEKYGADYREYSDHAHFLMRESGWEMIAEDIAEWLSKRKKINTQQLYK